MLLGGSERPEKYRLNNKILFFPRHPSFFSHILLHPAIYSKIE
jgi:hypothetical protein